MRTAKSSKKGMKMPKMSADMMEDMAAVRAAKKPKAAKPKAKKATTKKAVSRKKVAKKPAKKRSPGKAAGY